MGRRAAERERAAAKQRAEHASPQCVAYQELQALARRTLSEVEPRGPPVVRSKCSTLVEHLLKYSTLA